MSVIFILSCILLIAGAFGVLTRKNSNERLIGSTSLITGVIAMAIASVSIIPTGYVGVMRVFGVVQKQTLAEGINIVRPWVTVATRGIRGYQVQMTGDNALEVITAKGTRFSVDVSIPLRLERLAAAEIESKIANGAWRYEANGVLRKTFREEMARFGSFEDFQNRRAGRTPYQDEPSIGIWLGQKIQNNITSLFANTYDIKTKTPVHVGEVQIRDVNPPAAITQAAAELEAVKIEQQTERDKRKVEEIRVARREQEGAGTQNFLQHCQTA